MTAKVNYDREMQRVLEALPGGARSRLLLHACCAPCSSAVLERMTQYFDIDVLYYNPNIEPADEYERRVEELRRLARSLPVQGALRVIAGEYENARFHEAIRGLERVKEGGARCTKCFELRLGYAAEFAARGGYDYFTTTLTISPLKDAERLNGIGRAAGERFGVRWLPSDFKKRDGYRRSCALSAQYGLYRQDYCGCIYSKAERAAAGNGREE